MTKENLPDVNRYKQYNSGAGKEEIDERHFKKPLLNVLQYSSGAIKKGSDRYVDGAEAGMFFNLATRELYSGEEGIFIIPCHTKQVVVERTPRVKGKGGGNFVAEYEVHDPFIKDALAKNNNKFFGLKNQDNGNDLHNVYMMYAVRIKEAGSDAMLDTFAIPWASTKIKQYQEIMTRLRTYKNWEAYPLFVYQLKLTTQMEKKDDNDFFNICAEFAVENDIEKSLVPDGSSILEICAGLQNMVKKGEVSADYTTEDTSPEDQDQPF